jgi:hypothetical protein
MSLRSRSSEGRRFEQVRRSLSAAGRVFGGNYQNLQNQDLDEILPVVNAEAIVKNRTPPSDFPSSSSSDSDSSSDMTDKSSKSSVKRKSKKKSKKAKNDSYYAKQEKRQEEAFNKQRKLEAKYLEYTRSNPLGSALLDIVADNMALHKKLNFKESNLRVGDLCSAFHDHMELEREKVKQELLAASKETEMNILDKEMHAYQCKEKSSAPKEFSDSNVLITAAKRSDAIRIFPTKSKFNGTESQNGMNIHEFLSLMNSAQKQMKLSKEEFSEFLLMCTTGKPHVLIQDWIDNGADVEELYYNLYTHYDMRMTPEIARDKLHAYKARKNSSLAKVISDIMQLALRATCVLPQGVTRTASYNYEAVQALIRSLPPMASHSASNKYHTLSHRLGRQATFVELSRAMTVETNTIDNEIAKFGLATGPNNFAMKNGGKMFKGNKSNRSQQNNAFAVSAHPNKKKSRNNDHQGNGHNNEQQNGQNNDRPNRKTNAYFGT